VRIPGTGRVAVITGAAIAADALRYTGQGYVYGGNAARPGNWDCSSFVSYVLGRDLRLALPGGKWGQPGFPPGSHGPVVLDYARWPGSVPVSTPQAGDLCIWAGAGPNGHIGIAISPVSMVSALNPSAGTRRTPILGTGPAGAPLTFRRVAGVAAGPAIVTTPAAGGGGAAPRLIVAALVALAAPVILIAVFAAAGTAAAAAGVWAARQAVS
jgi:NlpC/P60 family